MNSAANDSQMILEMVGQGDPLGIALLCVVILLVVAAIVAAVISIILAVKYVKYNKKQNSCGKTGEQIARQILDENGLEKIRVKATGSLIFGNSYSHFFKKVRLRRRTWQKDSVSSLAMAAQKSCLAVLDKEGDPDMKRRIVLTPIINFGPFAFLPLIVIGVLLDVFLIGNGSVPCTVCACILGTALFLFAFILSLMVLKTEKKAQQRALEICRAEGLANAEEEEDMKALFRLYNLEYINNMIIALLQLIYYVLRLLAVAKNSRSASSN